MNESNIENNLNNSEQNVEVLAKKISETHNLDEIVEAVKINNGIQGSNRFFTYEEVYELIDSIKNGSEDPINLTNRCGLRDKVLELINLEKNDVTPNVISLLNEEGIKRSIVSANLIKVYVKNDKNQIEGSWKIRSFNPVDNKVDVYKKGPDGTNRNQIVSLDDLILWNTPS